MVLIVLGIIVVTALRARQRKARAGKHACEVVGRTEWYSHAVGVPSDVRFPIGQQGRGGEMDQQQCAVVRR